MDTDLNATLVLSSRRTKKLYSKRFAAKAGWFPLHILSDSITRDFNRRPYAFDINTYGEGILVFKLSTGDLAAKWLSSDGTWKDLGLVASRKRGVYHYYVAANIAKDGSVIAIWRRGTGGSSKIYWAYLKPRR